ncbi:MAG: tRNA (adenosine(37)-N6)-threonylcarbamoyltransferase complex ATPase subunit type 1 TsaE [Bacteroidetes bacterium]|nr:tRNA (adenosine(37)-N6)-threonylcarbamoyltransferase complex ATPase subunit type 1 TsaE [Bacteroidota bacterium]
MAFDSFETNFELDDIHNAAKQLLAWVGASKIISFSGTLGAGKTTFIRALCDELAVKDAVSSPTFALINDYVFGDGATEQHILHMDWYRLKSEEEALNAGMEDALHSLARYCFIEWPEQAPTLLTMPHIAVLLEADDVGRRSLVARKQPFYKAGILP